VLLLLLLLLFITGVLVYFEFLFYKEFRLIFYHFCTGNICWRRYALTNDFNDPPTLCTVLERVRSNFVICLAKRQKSWIATP